MNQHLPRPPRSPTQAAEGRPRWRWTLAEFDRFIELGILTKDDKVELIGGELVPMSPKGNRHERVRLKLTNWMSRRLPEDLMFLPEPGWRPGGDFYAEPDVIVATPFDPPQQVPGREVKLLIEIADSSKDYDLEVKARMYAEIGVAEYWVIEAPSLATHVHRKRSEDGYGDVKVRKSGSLLKPQLVPDIAIRLTELGLD